MLVRGVEGVAYDELGEIELCSGEKRRCKVLEINGGNALVQLFESSTGINLADSKVRFLGQSMELGVSAPTCSAVYLTAWAGPWTAARTSFPESGLDINGAAHESCGAELSRRSLSRPGVSAIDGLNTLVRGQKLPIFSASGLPHAQLAAQIARQAKVRGTGRAFRRGVRRYRHHL